MRISALPLTAIVAVGCTFNGGASSNSSGGFTSGTATGSNGTSGSGTTSSTSSGSIGTSGATGSIRVSITSPDAGGCFDIHEAPVVNLAASGFTFANGPCPNSGPCGPALIQLTGPTGSCDAMGSPPRSAMGAPPLQLNQNACPPVEGPNGLRAPSGIYTIGVYLLDESGQTPTLLTAPDGGPFASESFLESYHEGFQCSADPEVVLERPISRRLDGLDVKGNQIFVAENAGGHGALVTIPKAVQPLDGGVQVLLASADGGDFWPTDVATDGTYAFVDQNNGSGALYSVPVGGGSATDEGLGGALADGFNGTFWSGTGGLWLAPGGQAQGMLFTPGTGAQAIAADDTGIYFTNGEGVDFAPVDGGAAQLLVAPVSGESPEGIAVDALNVYWTANSQLGGANSHIRSAPKLGGDGGSQIVLDDLVLPFSLIADTSGPGGTVLYFASGQVSISRFIADDGGVQMVPNSYTGHTGTALHWFAIDGPYLYWTDDSHVYRMLK